MGNKKICLAKKDVDDLGNYIVALKECLWDDEEIIHHLTNILKIILERTTAKDIVLERPEHPKIIEKLYSKGDG